MPCETFQIETCTACVPRIRRQIHELQEKLKKLQEEPEKISKDIKNAEDFQDHMREQLKKAENSESTYMDSDSVHGAFQIYRIKRRTILMLRLCVLYCFIMLIFNPQL